MTWEKPAASKRAPLPRASDYTRGFLKDWQRLSHSGRYDMNRLKEAMMLLIANDGPLPPEWLDHPLTGDWDGHRECHIANGHPTVLAQRTWVHSRAERLLLLS